MFRLLGSAFKEIDSSILLYRVVDGEEALAYLKQAGPVYAETPRPDLILLNVNLPKISGIELLEAIKADEQMSSIPAIMFTSSSLDADRARCLALGAQEYLTKPVGYDELIDCLKNVCALAVKAAEQG